MEGGGERLSWTTSSRASSEHTAAEEDDLDRNEMGRYSPVASTSRQPPAEYRRIDMPPARRSSGSALPPGRVRSTIACVLCRKQKMKCEGPPAPCKRCRLARVSCKFEQPADPKSKEEILESRTLHLERQVAEINSQRFFAMESRIAALEAEVRFLRQQGYTYNLSASLPRPAPSPLSLTRTTGSASSFILPNFPLPTSQPPHSRSSSHRFLPQHQTPNIEPSSALHRQSSSRPYGPFQIYNTTRNLSSSQTPSSLSHLLEAVPIDARRERSGSDSQADAEQGIKLRRVEESGAVD